MIRHVLNKEIDREKWDICINSADVFLPYAYTWWLDVVSPGWEALVMDDYRAVMPLTAKKKFGFHYLYQPFLTQQLGVIAFQDQVKNTADFLDSVPPAYKFIDIQLNTGDHVNSGDYHITPRSNYILNLQPGYTVLSLNYHRNCRRNIQKGKLSNLLVREGVGVSVFRHFVERNIDRSVTDLNPDLFPVMEQLIHVCESRRCSEILGVYTHEEMLAAGWFVHFTHPDASKPSRILFMVCASSAGGKKKEAMYVLIDHVIAKYAGSHFELDFTGSNIPGVAYFNAGFGASKTTYPAIKRNSLPWWARIVKR